MKPRQDDLARSWLRWLLYVPLACLSLSIGTVVIAIHAVTRRLRFVAPVYGLSPDSLEREWSEWARFLPRAPPECESDPELIARMRGLIEDPAEPETERAFYLARYAPRLGRGIRPLVERYSSGEAGPLRTVARLRSFLLGEGSEPAPRAGSNRS